MRASAASAEISSKVTTLATTSSTTELTSLPVGKGELGSDNLYPAQHNTNTHQEQHYRQNQVLDQKVSGI